MRDAGSILHFILPVFGGVHTRQEGVGGGCSGASALSGGCSIP